MPTFGDTLIVEPGMLGRYELKYISYKDTTEFADIDKGSNDDYSFAQEVVYHQLLQPKISKEDFKQLDSKQFESLVKTLIARYVANSSNYIDTGNPYEDLRHTLNQDWNDMQRNSRELFSSLSSLQDSWSSQLGVIARSAAMEIAKPTLNVLGNITKSGLPTNLGEKRDWRHVKLYIRLLESGYAIFWIPRSSIVEQLTNAPDDSTRKKIIVSNRNAILDDCSEALELVNKKFLQDSRLHLEDAISSMRNGNDRAAQSAANICFDAQLDQIIDTAMLTRFQQITTQHESDTKKLRRLPRNMPILYLYAALQGHLVGKTLRKFNRLRPMTILTKYGRHASSHTVSNRQYNEHNALQALMVSTSILVTTQKLGKAWLTELAKY